jgi:hypothetical protein
MLSKQMKPVIALVLSICVSNALQCQESKPGSIMAPDKFDQWGDIRFDDEKLHLDKIAKQAKEWSLSIIYLVIHAGQTACVGEARARGIRAKNYLVGQGIASNRIVWIDAGWTKDLTVEVWIWPPQLGKPTPSTDTNLKQDDVTLQRSCKIKYRGKLITCSPQSIPAHLRRADYRMKLLCVSSAFFASPRQTICDALQPPRRKERRGGAESL